ncbi:redoxin domain-containing protein [Bradyrhizobium sp. Arg237L]|uniref:redoxin domain-containing protein n=1 Tax=Bradyrhizobium sp. Arg237L TaxID=3003352 RepID=UPI00249DCAEB|nr:redoxin domain-containing protein [Bradyrhizobium sp. Arg237L]MDI4238483.1 redoxin domain-containing protein [Bradyrhizobium sp. Arg237L]
MSLQDKLDALKAERLAKTPPKVTLVRQRAVEELAASGLAERAMHAGEQAPSFQLRDGYGEAFSSREALRRGPIVLVFYRRRWCPYCNVELVRHPGIIRLVARPKTTVAIEFSNFIVDAFRE